MHAALRAAGFRPTFFPTPTTSLWPHIRGAFPFFAHFDGYVLSYEHGAMKPEAKIYEVVEAANWPQGEAIIYWMTGQRTSRPGSRAAGRRSCTKRRKKPSPSCAGWGFLSALTLEKLRHSDRRGENAFGQVVQRQAGRLKSGESVSKIGAKLEFVRQTVMAGRAETSPAQFPVILQAREPALLGPGANPFGKHAGKKSE